MTATAEPFADCRDEAEPFDLVRSGPSEAELAAASAYLGRVLSCHVDKLYGTLGSYLLTHPAGEVALTSDTMVALANFLRTRPKPT